MPSKVSNNKPKKTKTSRKKQQQSKAPRVDKSTATDDSSTDVANSANVSLNASTNGGNRLITDYFHIRKSTRRCGSDLEKERRGAIERALKAAREEGVEVRHTAEKGRGVFAMREFERGEFVCEYAGELISFKVAKKREEMYASDSAVGCYMYYFEYRSKQLCVDATAETTRLGRLLNHSKLGGNCHTKLFEMGDVPHLILVASRRIHAGEEMTYDYGDRNKMAIECHPWLAQ